MVPTAPDWLIWVGLMVTTHFDLVLGPFWVPGGPKRAIWPRSLNFHGYFIYGMLFHCIAWYSIVLHGVVEFI